MSHLSHPVKAEKVTVAYPKDGQFAGNAVLHRTGCQHTARKSWDKVYGPPSDMSRVPSPEDGYEDDYYAVAPCAR